VVLCPILNSDLPLWLTTTDSIYGIEAQALQILLAQGLPNKAALPNQWRKLNKV